MVDRDELRAVRKGPLDLHLVDHLGDTFHDVVAPEDRQPRLHQLRYRAAVADTLENLGGDDGKRFGVIEPETTRATPSRQLGGGEHQQLLLLPRREVHRWTSEPRQPDAASLDRRADPWWRRPRPPSPWP